MCPSHERRCSFVSSKQQLAKHENQKETKHCWITMWSSRKQVCHDDQSWYPPNSWVASLAMDSWAIAPADTTGQTILQWRNQWHLPKWSPWRSNVKEYRFYFFWEGTHTHTHTPSQEGWVFTTTFYSTSKSIKSGHNEHGANALPHLNTSEIMRTEWRQPYIQYSWRSLLLSLIKKTFRVVSS